MAASPSTMSPPGADSESVEEPQAGLIGRALDAIADGVDAAPRSVFFALSGAACVWIVAQAWIAEDAFITYRSLDNLVNGHGLRWNVDERVQTYTHPLWALLHLPLHFVTGSWPVASFLLSLGCVAGALAAVRTLCARGADRFALLVLLPFAISPALRVFAFSGLENPLTQWMLAAAALLLLGERSAQADAPPWRAFACVTAIAALTRLDTLLLIAPAWLVLLRQRPEAAGWRALAWAVLAVCAWEAFSLFYYGLPFPNTKYAKLDTGVPAAELFVRGIYHLRELFYREPQTLLLGGTGLGLALRSQWIRRGDSQPAERERAALSGALAAGALLYVGYATVIGGGFMQGRFLAAPMWIGLVLAAYALRDAPTRRWLPLPLAALALAGFSALVMAFSPGHTAYFGVVDEQGVFRRTNMLWTQWLDAPGRRFADHQFSQRGLAARARAQAASDGAPEVVTLGAAGMLGYYAGPDVIGLDIHALCDPLLARLPMSRERLAEGNWRSGHFRREIPAGYAHARATGDTSEMDPDLARYYERIRHITRGPLLSRARLLDVVRFNLGGYEHLRESYSKRLGGRP